MSTAFNPLEPSRKIRVEVYDDGRRSGVEIHFPFAPEKALVKILRKRGFRRAFRKGKPYFFAPLSSDNWVFAMDLKQAMENGPKPEIDEETRQSLYQVETHEGQAPELVHPNPELPQMLLSSEDSSIGLQAIADRINRVLRKLGILDLYTTADNDGQFRAGIRSWVRRTGKLGLGAGGFIESDGEVELNKDEADTFLKTYHKDLSTLRLKYVAQESLSNPRAWVMSGFLMPERTFPISINRALKKASAWDVELRDLLLDIRKAAQVEINAHAKRFYSVEVVEFVKAAMKMGVEGTTLNRLDSLLTTLSDFANSNPIWWEKLPESWKRILMALEGLLVHVYNEHLHLGEDEVFELSITPKMREVLEQWLGGEGQELSGPGEPELKLGKQAVVRIGGKRFVLSGKRLEKMQKAGTIKGSGDKEGIERYMALVGLLHEKEAVLSGPVETYLVPPPKVFGKPHLVNYSADSNPEQTVEYFNFAPEWEELWGSPAKGFSALVSGPPKQGKSTLALDFAGYLAREGFGPVLYASFEEADKPTIRERKKRLGAEHPALHIMNHLPADLSNWEVVFLDSISKGKVGIELIEHLLGHWPGKTFVFIAQVTKQGKARGSNEIAHEVDVLVSVDQGEAVAEGRFGSGGRVVRFG